MQAFNPRISQTENIEITTSLLSFPDGEQKTIIMNDIPPDELENLSLGEKGLNFDLICICFDNKNHLIRFLKENGTFLPKYVPKIAIHCKNDDEFFEHFDLDRLTEQQLGDEYGIREIVESSAKKENVRDALIGITKVIKNP